MYYEEILAHPATPDDIRRSAESRLLRHQYRLMNCLSRNTPAQDPPHTEPPTQHSQNLFDPVRPSTAIPSKESVRQYVQELVEGMVLLKVEDESAWAITLEWLDARELAQYPLSFLHEYSLLFPTSPYTTLIAGYLRYYGIAGPDEELQQAIKAQRKERRRQKKGYKKSNKSAKQDQDEKEPEVSPEEALKTEENKRKEPFTVLINGLEGLPKSLFGHKVLTQVYLEEGDHASCIATAEKAQQTISAMDIETGLKYGQSKLYLDVLLGTALVHYYAPKHHPRALQLLNSVLKVEPDSVKCSIGRGYVFAGEQKWSEAQVEFEKVINLEEQARGDALPKEDLPAGTTWSPIEIEAREQQGWCLVKQGSSQQGKAILSDVAQMFDLSELRSEESARIWWRIGCADWDLGGEHRDDAYEAFAKSLRYSNSYAPSFTAIGIWYIEHANPPDHDRASKSFQKAFELDATQAEAARRLATGFANEGEWALVSTIAKRVMEGEGGIEGGLVGNDSTATSKFLPTNSWAWKAFGAVQMHYKKFNEAAQAFQVALRAEPEDATIWTRLGEAYAKSGRHIAALKALNQALLLDPELWICHYHIGNVQRELGSYQQAIEAFKRAAELRPEEPGTIIALTDSWLALGKSEREVGLRDRAFGSTLESLRCVGIMLDHKPYRKTCWKLFGDACLNLIGCVGESDDFSAVLEAVVPVLESLRDADEDKASTVPGVTSAAKLLNAAAFGKEELLKAAIVAFAYRGHLLRFDNKIAELPLYDTACALHLLATILAESNPDHTEIQPAQCAAVSYIERALEIDPSSSILWNAFGVVSAQVSPQLAQHAYVIALDMQPKNTEYWCNYGFLCLQSGEHVLANKAFSKAQIIEPEAAQAWLGQALVAFERGDHSDAQLIFEQASTLSGGNLLISGLGFSALLFAPSVTQAYSLDVDSLHQPSFVLSRYCEENPQDSSALLLHALILERLGLPTAAISRVDQAVRVLERRYEATESTKLERQYAVALLNLGRLQLGVGENEQACSTVSDCIGLCADRTDDEGLAMLAQCHLLTALSSANQGEVDDALDAFQKSIAAAERLTVLTKRDQCKERISVLLARTLWHFQADESRAAAKDNLLEAFSADDHTTEAIVTLATLGVLTDDEGIVEAVVSEIEELGLAKTEDYGTLSYLRALIKLTEGNVTSAERILTAAVHTKPEDAKNRIRLAKLLLATGKASSATGLIDHLHEIKRDTLVEDVAAAMAVKSLIEAKLGQADGLRMGQKAVKLEPWNSDNIAAIFASYDPSDASS